MSATVMVIRRLKRLKRLYSRGQQQQKTTEGQLKMRDKPGIVVYACNPSTRRLRQKDCHMFQDNLGYRVEPYL